MAPRRPHRRMRPSATRRSFHASGRGASGTPASRPAAARALRARISSVEAASTMRSSEKFGRRFRNCAELRRADLHRVESSAVRRDAERQPQRLERALRRRRRERDRAGVGAGSGPSTAAAGPPSARPRCRSKPSSASSGSDRPRRLRRVPSACPPIASTAIFWDRRRGRRSAPRSSASPIARCVVAKTRPRGERPGGAFCASRRSTSSSPRSPPPSRSG